MLGALLDQAEKEGRSQATRAERSAIARAGIAERLRVRASSSPLTLLLGGIGIVLATLNPLVARAVFQFPVSNDWSWLNDSWQTLPTEISAALFVIAMAVLAFGVRGEVGIAGRSRPGQILLVVFALANLVLVIVDEGPLVRLGTSKVILALVGVASWVCFVAGAVALLVASVIVLRAAVLRGPARWALVLLAVLAVGPLAVSRVHSLAVGEIVLGVIDPLALVVQLLIGVLFIRTGLVGGARNRARVGKSSI